MNGEHGRRGLLKFDRRWFPDPEPNCIFQGKIYVDKSRGFEEVYFLPDEQDSIKIGQIKAYKLSTNEVLEDGIEKEKDDGVIPPLYLTERSMIRTSFLDKELRERMIDWWENENYLGERRVPGFAKEMFPDAQIDEVLPGIYSVKGQSSIADLLNYLSGESGLEEPIDFPKISENSLMGGLEEIMKFQNCLSEIIIDNPGISNLEFQKIAMEEYENQGLSKDYLSQMDLYIEMNGEEYTFPPKDLE